MYSCDSRGNLYTMSCLFESMLGVVSMILTKNRQITIRDLLNGNPDLNFDHLAFVVRSQNHRAISHLEH